MREKTSGFQSMSSKGDCRDNAVDGSFFHTLKTHVMFHAHFRDKNVAEPRIVQLYRGILSHEARHFAIDFETPQSLNGIKKDDKAWFNSSSTSLGKDQPVNIAMNAKKWKRDVLKWFLSPLLNWDPLETPNEGYSIILGVPWALRHLLPVKLEFVQRTDIEQPHCIHFVFD